MNERIRELAKQCWDQRLDGQLHFDTEQFAELIIQECMKVCKNIEYYDADPVPETNGHIRAGAAFCREDIKKHFGVEE